MSPKEFFGLVRLVFPFTKFENYNVNNSILFPEDEIKNNLFAKSVEIEEQDQVSLK